MMTKMKCALSMAGLLLAATAVAGSKAPPRLPALAAYTNDHAVLEIDRLGRFARLADRAGGENLVKLLPTLSIAGTNRVGRHVRDISVKDGRLHYRLYDWDGEIVLNVRTERWGFVFTVESCTLKSAVPVASYTLFQLYPTDDFKSGYGYVLNAASNPTHTIVLRGYATECESLTGGTMLLRAVLDGTRDPVGQRFAIVLAKRGDETVSCLMDMTRDAGWFHTACGGAWSLEAPENRRSYLFAPITSESIDDWIELAELGGFQTLHFNSWWKALGHYEPNLKKFPRGEADLKACVDRARAAGLAVSTHTLCSGIAFSDPWITPACNTNVLSLYRYTLAEPLAEDAKELVVAERPGPRHDLVTAYFSNGNILRIGTELMTYDGLTREAPYRFTGLKRGAYGTRKVGPVAKGSRVDYVFQHFYTLFPDPKTPFGTEMAQHLGDLCGRMGFSFVYQDGAEPFSKYDVALNRLNFARALDQSKGPVQIEASTCNNESWPFHSRFGAFDYPTWAMKRFHDYHLRTVRSAMRNNYLCGQMGWWSSRLGNESANGYDLDDMEYFAAKNAAWDLPMAIDGVRASNGRLPLAHARQMTLLGWYERARLARAFSPDALELLRRERGETFLRQDASGRWTLTGVKVATHRVGSSDYRAWTAETGRDASASLRVKALYGAAPYASTNAVRLVGAEDLGALKRASSKDVSFSLTAGTDAAHGPTLRFVAENRGTQPPGSWAEAALTYDHPYRDVRVKGCAPSNAAFGFWLKGDGSGAVLDLQVRTPAIFVGGVSDHIVKIDFTGWRYVQVFLRERDVDEYYNNHGWPDRPRFYAHYRQIVSLQRLDSVRLCLARIPPGGRTEIEISPIKVLPTRALTLRNAALGVGGVRHPLPFELKSGDFAELDGGVWTRYSLAGEALAQAPAAACVSLADGATDFAFSAESAEGDPRAEVQVFARGRAVPAFAARPAEPDFLASEAVMPMPFDPAKGFAKLPPVRARPGETARLEFTVYGAVTDPSVTIGGETVVFPVAVAADEKLVVRDGLSWQVLGARRQTVAEGRLARPLPALAPGEAAVFSARAGANARFAVTKRYVPSRAR